MPRTEASRPARVQKRPGGACRARRVGSDAHQGELMSPGRAGAQALCSRRRRPARRRSRRRARARRCRRAPDRPPARGAASARAPAGWPKGCRRCRAPSRWGSPRSGTRPGPRPPAGRGSRRRRSSCRRWHRGGVNDADHAATACPRRVRSERLSHQKGEPIPALTQPIQQSHIADVDKADRRRPRGCRSQTPLAQAIGQDQTQQIDRAINHPRAQERLCLARTLLKLRRPAKSGDDATPILIAQRFVSHPSWESHALSPRKCYFSAYARKRGPRASWYGTSRFPLARE